jgi:hypothetical protein
MKKPTKYLKDIIAYSLIILLVSILIVILSWIFYELFNSLFLYFDSNIHVEFYFVLISVIMCVTAIILLSMLFYKTSPKSSFKSKAMQYEEDSRWFHDYCGDDYY